jgi:uncharacterized protein involved in exopolysaccharide biosynthesis
MDGAAEVTLLSVLTVVLRHRRLILLFAFVGAVAAAVATLLAPPRYAASARFLPKGRQSGAGGLSALASQIGLSAGAVGEPGQTPDFYAELVLSRAVLGAIVDGPLPVAAGRSVSLADVYGVEGETPTARRDAAIEELGRHVDATAEPKTGTVQLAVSAADAGVAYAVAGRILAQLNEFNLKRRQSQAREERRFAERRLAELRVQQRAAEDRLQLFLQQNREYSNSPALAFEQVRLDRSVSQAQALVTSLSQAYEQARMEEVRDTPVITVIEAPELPARPEPRRTGTKAIIGLVLGTVVGLLVALVRGYFAGLRGTDRSTYGAFEAERREALADLRRPWRVLAFGRGARRTVAS